jgi:transglutaminase-like putative cysteine protease
MKPRSHPLALESRPVTLHDVAGIVLSLVIVAAPHAAHSPWWLSVLTASMYAWRLYLALANKPLPSRWILFTTALAAAIGVWLEYRVLFGRAPGVALLAVFSGLKLLESRNQRDATVLVFLCYFLIITNFLTAQTIPTAIAMCAALVAITVTQIGFSAARRGWRANLRTAGVLLAHATPAALALFVLFPRVQGPLWGLPQDAYSALSGLTDRMSPGNIAQLVLSDAIAFRAEFAGDPPPQIYRYWRGPVLWDFDGREWRSGFPPPMRDEAPPSGAAAYRYTVTLEANNLDWLFALETAVRYPSDARLTGDGQLLSRAPVRNRLRYQVESVLDAKPRTDEDPISLRRALRLPRDINPRTRERAHPWQAAASNDADILARALQFLREDRLAYTLEPPLLGRDSVDEFLFDSKAGFCEHFSSSFVFMMRAAGVPARVVMGYQGGDLNPVDRIVTVRQSDAHAWSEVFLAGRGWTRVDPTAAAAPSRIESGLAGAAPRGMPLPMLARQEFEWLRSLRNNWEAVAYKWNVWIIGYNTERQRDLLTWVGASNTDWKSLAALLLATLGSIVALLIAWSMRDAARRDPVLAAWQMFCRKLGARGVVRSPHEGPRDFVRRAALGLPSSGAAIERIGALYVALRYGAQASAREVAELRQLVSDLRFA